MLLWIRKKWLKVSQILGGPNYNLWCWKKRFSCQRYILDSFFSQRKIAFVLWIEVLFFLFSIIICNITVCDLSTSKVDKAYNNLIFLKTDTAWSEMKSFFCQPLTLFPLISPNKIQLFKENCEQTFIFYFPLPFPQR